MTRLVFAIPGELQTRSGGYEYDRRLLAALGPAGVEAVHCRLPASFPDRQATPISKQASRRSRASFGRATWL